MAQPANTSPSRTPPTGGLEDGKVSVLESRPKSIDSLHGCLYCPCPAPSQSVSLVTTACGPCSVWPFGAQRYSPVLSSRQPVPGAQCHEAITLSPNDALVTNGPLAYSTRWGVWRDIEVGSRLALLSLVTSSLPSPQKISLMGCAAPPFISSKHSHLLSDLGLFVLPVTPGSQQGAPCHASLG